MANPILGVCLPVLVLLLPSEKLIVVLAKPKRSFSFMRASLAWLPVGSSMSTLEFAAVAALMYRVGINCKRPRALAILSNELDLGYDKVKRLMKMLFEIHVSRAPALSHSTTAR